MISWRRRRRFKDLQDLVLGEEPVPYVTPDEILLRLLSIMSIGITVLAVVVIITGLLR